MPLHRNSSAIRSTIALCFRSCALAPCRMDQLVQETTAELQDFMSASFNGFKYYNCQFPKCVLWSDSTPRGITNNSRQTWIWFMRLAEGFYIRPVSFQASSPEALHCFAAILCAKHYLLAQPTLVLPRVPSDGKTLKHPLP